MCEIRTRDVLAENEVALATGPTRHGALDGNPTHHDPLDRRASSAADSEGIFERCGSGESNPGLNHGKVVGFHCLTTAGFPRAELSGYLDVISVASRPLDRLGNDMCVGVIGQIRTGPYEGHDLACCTADTTTTMIL